jgi:hypothetical protein
MPYLTLLIAFAHWRVTLAQNVVKSAHDFVLQSRGAKLAL